MTNTVNQIQVPASSTGVVVQSIGRAAGKTFIQAFLAAFAAPFLTFLGTITEAINAGEWPDMGDANFLGRIVAAAIVAALASLFSFIYNLYGAKTLPAGHVVEAEVKP